MNTTLPAPASIKTVSAISVTSAPPLLPLLTRAGQGRVIRAFGDEISLLMTGNDTDGAYTAFICTTPPGGGPPPHRHEREDEWFFVLDGVVSFLINERWHDAQRGDFVFAPRGSVHTFKNNTAEAVRMLIHTSPSGFENFFAEAEQAFNRPGGPDLALAVAIAAKHGIQIMAP